MVQRWKLVDSLSADTNWQSTGQKLLLSGGVSIKNMMPQVCGRLLLVHQPATENYSVFSVLKTMKSVRSPPTFFWYLMGFLGGFVGSSSVLSELRCRLPPCSGPLQHSHDLQRHPCQAVLILVRVHRSTTREYSSAAVSHFSSGAAADHCGKACNYIWRTPHHESRVCTSEVIPLVCPLYGIESHQEPFKSGESAKRLLYWNLTRLSDAVSL